VECAELGADTSEMALPELALPQMLGMPGEDWKMKCGRYRKKIHCQRFCWSDVEVVEESLRTPFTLWLYISDQIERCEVCQAREIMRDRGQRWTTTKSFESRCSFALIIRCWRFLLQALSQELSNVYLRCDGCESIWWRFQLICFQCHSKDGTRFVWMHDLLDKVIHWSQYKECF
jgi:hypothetical protein